MKVTKTTKKLFAFLLAAIMLMAMSATAFAAELNIGNSVEGQTYNAYKLFDVTTSTSQVGDETKTNYSYTLASTETGLISLLQGAGLTLTPSADGSVYMVTAGLETDEDARDLAAYLNQNVDELGEADGSATGNDGTVTITDLDAGYYFVTTTTGSLCILNTTGAVNIEEKNEAPSVDKEVTDADPDTAEVGDTVNYEITITAQPGAENYVLHDEMSEGLTLNKHIEVKVGENSLTEDTDYSITYGAEDGCDFEISFTKSYLDSIKAATEITITYSAVLNENAATEEINPETNEAILKYGEKNNVETIPAETKTYTYSFDFLKTDEENTPLTGAEFELYDVAEDGDPISLVEIQKGVYRLATDGDKTVTTTIAVDNDGEATIMGLAGKTYWLQETKAPDGYNKLTTRQEVTFIEEEDPASGSFVDVTVVNEAGALLPSTGGMGTTVIYIIGAVLVIGAGIVLVVRRRTNA